MEGRLIRLSLGKVSRSLIIGPSSFQYSSVNWSRQSVAQCSVQSAEPIDAT
jgi:hypothetical protein